MPQFDLSNTLSGTPGQMRVFGDALVEFGDALVEIDFTRAMAFWQNSITPLSSLLTCTRATAGAALNSQNEIIEFPPDVMRVTNRGLLIEEGKTNYFLQSKSPTPQIIALPTGTFTLWILGAGSVTLSGDASGVAMAGAPLSFTLAVPGSVTVGLSGDISFVQLENGSSASGPIITLGVAVSRELDRVSFIDASWFDPQNCTILVEWEQMTPGVDVQNLIRWSNASYSRLRSGAVAFAQINDISGNLVFNSGNADIVPIGIHKMAVALAPDDMEVAWSASFDGTVGSSVGTSGIPAPGADAIFLGSNGAAAPLSGCLRRLVYWDERISGSLLSQLV